MATTEPIRDPADVKAMMNHCLSNKEYRNYCFLGFGVYSALRVGDLITMTWDDVYDFNKCEFKENVRLTEQKTRKGKIIFLNEHLIQILRDYKDELEKSLGGVSPGIYIFKSQKGVNRPITRQQAYRITRQSARKAGVGGVIGCHSLRKTFGYAAHSIGTPPTVIMDIFNHSSYQVTKRYLGIDQDEKDAVYRQISFR